MNAFTPDLAKDNEYLISKNSSNKFLAGKLRDHPEYRAEFHFTGPGRVIFVYKGDVKIAAIADGGFGTALHDELVREFVVAHIKVSRATGIVVDMAGSGEVTLFPHKRGQEEES